MRCHTASVALPASPEHFINGPVIHAARHPVDVACFYELLATRHDGPLLGAAPEAMLSCQRDVAAMVLHDVSLWAAWVVAGLDGSAVPGATHVKLRGDEVRVRDIFINDCKSLKAVDLSGLPSLTQVGERFPCNN